MQTLNRNDSWGNFCVLGNIKLSTKVVGMEVWELVVTSIPNIFSNLPILSWNNLGTLNEKLQKSHQSDNPAQNLRCGSSDWWHEYTTHYMVSLRDIRGIEGINCSKLGKGLDDTETSHLLTHLRLFYHFHWKMLTLHFVCLHTQFTCFSIYFYGIHWGWPPFSLHL